MSPFKDLVKQNTHFIWNQSHEKAFNQSKQIIVGLVKKGITNFDTNSVTCLGLDCSKEHMGFLLLQKHCRCPTKKTLVCSSEGWLTAFAGSRCRMVIWTHWRWSSCNCLGIKKCHIIIMGCPNIIVMTNHQPLTEIFEDRDLSKIHNPWLFKLKVKSLRYYFAIQHCPHKWHKGSDAISCNPVATVEPLLSLFSTQPFFKDSDNIDSAMELATLQVITRYGDNNLVISPDHFHRKVLN